MIQPLLKLYKKNSILSSISAVLNWDQETYMPRGAADFRATQGAFLAEMAHELVTSDRFRGCLSEHVDLATGAIDPGITSPVDTANLKLAYREWVHANRVSKDWVVAMAETTSKAQLIWADARATNHFASFAPILESLIQLTAQRAEAVGYVHEPYDALLDDHEPGMTTQYVSQLFAHLRPILRAIIDRTAGRSVPLLPTGPFSIDRQERISHDLLRRIGFDVSRGRLDRSTHPFSTSFHPTDCRITTRFSDTDIMENISSTLHEGGHALYEQGIPEAWFGQPVGTSISLGVHESQSRLWENIIGKSIPFWQTYLPILSTEFPEFADMSTHSFVAAINPVMPTCIRVSADEVTYNLHISVRFQIEQALFSRQLAVRDLPSAWNELMRSELGVVPATDREGVLQDVHWACGGFGYFPTYTIGNLMAAQFIEAAAHQIPRWSDHMAAGDWIPLTQWLNTAIHQKGRSVTSDELMRQVTGRSLDVSAFERYLNQKF